jgi:hypothetical protein
MGERQLVVRSGRIGKRRTTSEYRRPNFSAFGLQSFSLFRFPLAPAAGGPFALWLPMSSPSAFPSLPPAQARLLRSRLRLSIRDAGLTDLTPTAGETPADAPPFWELEPTPLVLDADEWSRIEAALCQRARFVNALLVDFYTDRRVAPGEPPPARGGARRPVLPPALHRAGARPRQPRDHAALRPGENGRRLDVLRHARQHPLRLRLRRAKPALPHAGGVGALPHAARLPERGQFSAPTARRAARPRPRGRPPPLDRGAHGRAARPVLLRAQLPRPQDGPAARPRRRPAGARQPGVVQDHRRPGAGGRAVSAAQRRPYRPGRLLDRPRDRRHPRPAPVHPGRPRGRRQRHRHGGRREPRARRLPAAAHALLPGRETAPALAAHLHLRRHRPARLHPRPARHAPPPPRPRPAHRRPPPARARARAPRRARPRRRRPREPPRLRRPPRHHPVPHRAGREEIPPLPAGGLCPLGGTALLRVPRRSRPARRG